MDLTNRVAEGRFVSPEIFWRSSPRGVDLLSFVTPNPQHPMARWLFEDPLALKPDDLRRIHGVAQPRGAGDHRAGDVLRVDTGRASAGS